MSLLVKGLSSLRRNERLGLPQGSKSLKGQVVGYPFSPPCLGQGLIPGSNHRLLLQYSGVFSMLRSDTCLSGFSCWWSQLPKTWGSRKEALTTGLGLVAADPELSFHNLVKKASHPLAGLDGYSGPTEWRERCFHVLEPEACRWFRQRTTVVCLQR